MHLKKFFLWFSLTALFFVLAVWISPAHAADLGGCPKNDIGQYTCPGNLIRLQVPIPGLGNTCSYQTGDGQTEYLHCVTGFPAYIKSAYNFFIGITGILAVIMIMVGGFQWLLAAGNSQKISGAKTTILSAIMGLVLALTSYTILYLLNPDILSLHLAVPEVSLNSVTATNYCTDNQQIELKGDSYAKCGQTYALKDKPDEFCLGVVCSTGMKMEETCFKYDNNNYTCNKTVDIKDNQNGYGNTQADLKKSSPCGAIVYNASKKLVYGANCNDKNKFCVIDLDKGVYFNISKEQAKNGDTVGQLLGAKCIEFKNGPTYSD